MSVKTSTARISVYKYALFRGARLPIILLGFEQCGSAHEGTRLLIAIRGERGGGCQNSARMGEGGVQIRHQ